MVTTAAQMRTQLVVMPLPCVIPASVVKNQGRCPGSSQLRHPVTPMPVPSQAWWHQHTHRCFMAGYLHLLPEKVFIATFDLFL